MKLYLVRHGEAIPEHIDAQSPLSQKGREDILAMGHFLAKISPDVSHIFHSGLLRAQQTAEIIAKGIHFTSPLEHYAEMTPYDSVSSLAQHINQASSNLLAVGHMPFLGLLVSRLVLSNENQEIIYFQKGTIVCLKRIPHTNDWLIDWVMNPDVKININIV